MNAPVRNILIVIKNISINSHEQKLSNNNLKTNINLTPGKTPVNEIGKSIQSNTESFSSTNEYNECISKEYFFLHYNIRFNNYDQIPNNNNSKTNIDLTPDKSFDNKKNRFNQI